MIDSFIAYIERLELMAFFSGYPLIYALAHFMAGTGLAKKNQFSILLLRSLSTGYALIGSLFFLFWIREMSIRSGIRNIDVAFSLSPLKAWALLAVFFWIPSIAKRPVYSLIHSLVFFFILFKDLLTGIGSGTGIEIIANDMKVYTISLILNLISLISCLTASRYLPRLFRRR
jgi:hypothetical protein